MFNAVSQNTYAAALARAERDGVVITGKGTRKSDGVTIYATQSQTGSAYLVAVTAAGWDCQCQGGRSGHFCKHAAVVLERTRAELTRKPAPDRLAVLAQAADAVNLTRERRETSALRSRPAFSVLKV